MFKKTLVVPFLFGIFLLFLIEYFKVIAEDEILPEPQLEVLLPTDFEDHPDITVERFFKYQPGVQTCNIFPVIDHNPKEVPLQICFDSEISSSRTTIVEEKPKTCTIHRFRPSAEGQEELVYFIRQERNTIGFYSSSNPGNVIASIVGGRYVPPSSIDAHKLDNVGVEHIINFASQSMTIRYIREQHQQDPIDIQINPPLFTSPFSAMLTIPKGFSANFSMTRIEGFPGPNFAIKTPFDGQIAGNFMPSSKYLADRNGYKIVKIEGDCEPFIKSYLYLMYLSQDMLEKGFATQKLVPIIFPPLPSFNSR